MFDVRIDRGEAESVQTDLANFRVELYSTDELFTRKDSFIVMDYIVDDATDLGTKVRQALQRLFSVYKEKL